MARKTHGQFYLKKTTNGNLVGEWSNNDQPHIFTESCDLDGTADGHIGTYHSTWQEQGQAISSRLTIKKNGSLFSLEWVVIGTATIFDGKGMLCGDILIGSYRAR